MASLDEAAAAQRVVAAMEAALDEARNARDEMIAGLAAQGIAHRVIAEALDLSLPAAGKIARAEGVIQWRRDGGRQVSAQAADDAARYRPV
jgi:hypothetical protein